MFFQPYETTALAPQFPKTQIHAIQAAIARRELTPVNGSQEILEITGESKDIKPFFHPIVLESFGKSYVVMDSRPYIRLNREGQRVVLNQADYTFATTRAVLVLGVARKGMITALGVLGDIPARTFTITLSTSINRRLGLQITDEVRLVALTAHYWYCMVTPREQFESEGGFANRISRITKVPAFTAQEVLSDVGYLENLNDFCEAIKRVVPTPRTETINPALLFTMLGGIWFGVDAPGSVRAALEYPAYWTAMCYTAITDRSFNKTGLGRDIQNFNRRPADQEHFVRAMKEFVRGALTNES